MSLDEALNILDAAEPWDGPQGDGTIVMPKEAPIALVDALCFIALRAPETLPPWLREFVLHPRRFSLVGWDEDRAVWMRGEIPS